MATRYDLSSSIRLGEFANAEKIVKQVLSFPFHQHLKEKEIKYVCEKINNFYK